MQDKARQILRAAEKLFMSRRYHQATIEEVARKAGVGKGTIYRYFKDKEDLYYKIILTGLDELVESLEPSEGDKEDSAQELRTVVSKIVEFFSRRRSLFALMRSEQLRRSSARKKVWGQCKQKNEKIIGAVASVIGRGMETGRYKDRLPPKAAARLLLGMVRSALWHTDDMPEGEDLSGIITHVFDEGLGTRAFDSPREEQG